MIRRLAPLADLAIVGMSVVLPGGGDLAEFGRRVYRQLPLEAQFDQALTLEAAALRSLQQVCAQAHLVDRPVPLVSLSPALERTLQESGAASRIQAAADVTSALLLASDGLESGGEDLVLLFEASPAPQAVCTLLLAQYRPALDNSRPVHARLMAAAQAQAPLTSTVISAVLAEARRAAGLPPEWIGLSVTPAVEDTHYQQAQWTGYLEAFDSPEAFTCAIHPGQPGLLGLLETAWCLSRRVIPGASAWSAPARPGVRASPFYLPAESRAWFIPAVQENRHAALDLLSAEDSFTHLLLSDAPRPASVGMEAPSREPGRLFPLAAASVDALLNKIAALRSELAAGAALPGLARSVYRDYLLDRPAARSVACLVAHTPQELLRELDFAGKGIPEALNKQSDWQTPLGSSFSPAPLGEAGGVSFVYPGAFNSYPGVGRDLFYLYPNLSDAISELTDDLGGVLNERLLYPRSLAALTPLDLAALEAQLTADPVAMVTSGSCLAALFTDLLRTIFGIHPASAFGYSLGEISMLYASRVWTTGDLATRALRESPLFQTRLSGPQNAVREFWDLPPVAEAAPHELLWANYLLMVGPDQVREVLPQEARVYLTHINTPRQVVIGGDPAACRRIIDRLKCRSIQAPFNYALHCEPIHSELAMMTELHSNPVKGPPDLTLYSAATYAPMPLDRENIARQVAQALCTYLDFPRLIQAAYADGARIFIELGAGGNCARWINETLPGRPHAAYSINRKGVDDHLSILRLLARLVAQHVPLNLSVLYQE